MRIPANQEETVRQPNTEVNKGYGWKIHRKKTWMANNYMGKSSYLLVIKKLKIKIRHDFAYSLGDWNLKIRQCPVLVRIWRNRHSHSLLEGKDIGATIQRTNLNI